MPIVNYSWPPAMSESTLTMGVVPSFHCLKQTVFLSGYYVNCERYVCIKFFITEEIAYHQCIQTTKVT